MKQETINFKKERDFGELFNATFSFIGQEFKQLGKAVLYFVVPFLLLSAIAGTFYSLKANEISQSVTPNGGDPFAAFARVGSLFLDMVPFVLLSLVATTMMIGTVYNYIRLYIEKGSGGFSLNDVWMQTTKNFPRLFFAIFVTGLVVGAGFGFCFIPGIYLGVALSIMFSIMIFEDLNFGDSFSRSIRLVNKQWWFSFGLLLVMFIIVAILDVLISLPAVLLGLRTFFMNFRHIKAGQYQMQNLPLGFYIINSLTSLVNHLLTVIPIVLTSFLYFSLVEKIEKPSLIEKIDQIGADE